MVYLVSFEGEEGDDAMMGYLTENWEVFLELWLDLWVGDA